jgi:hypothetical protein
MPAAAAQVQVQLQKLISEDRLMLVAVSSMEKHVVVPDER